MTDSDTDMERIQVEIEKTFVTYFPLFGVATGLGLFKRLPTFGIRRPLGNPWVRGASLAAVAATQALSARDQAIEMRKINVSLMEAAYQNRFPCMRLLLPGNFEKLRAFMVAKYLSFDIRDRVATLYSPDAIMVKSLIRGASFGLLWPFYHDSILNYMYAALIGRQDLTDRVGPDRPSHMERHELEVVSWYEMKTGKWMYDINDPNKLETMEEWRASPECWYGRLGKPPVIPFNIEFNES